MWLLYFSQWDNPVLFYLVRNESPDGSYQTDRPGNTWWTCHSYQSHQLCSQVGLSPISMPWFSFSVLPTLPTLPPHHSCWWTWRPPCQPQEERGNKGSCAVFLLTPLIPEWQTWSLTRDARMSWPSNLLHDASHDRFLLHQRVSTTFSQISALKPRPKAKETIWRDGSDSFFLINF